MSELVKLTVDDKELRLRFSRLKAGIQPKPILSIASEVMMSSIDRTFKQEGSPAGSWPGLKASTKKRYAKKGKLSGHKLLILSRRMRNSIAPSIEGNTLTIGTNVIYARRRSLDRPFLILRPEDPARLGKAIDTYLKAIDEGAAG